MGARVRERRVAARDDAASERTSVREPPAAVREVVDALIEGLGGKVSALLWHGSWARGEETPASDHDLIVVLRKVDDEALMAIREVFAGLPGWSTYITSEEELRQYPLTGRLQFHYGLIPLFGELEPPAISRKDLVEDIRLLATNIQHECRYRLVHGSRKIDAGLEQEFVQLRNARWMYHQAKLAVLAPKAREILWGRAYPETRAELRERLKDEAELAILDIVDLWPELRAKFEQDSTPPALQIDAVAGKLLSELEAGAGK